MAGSGLHWRNRFKPKSGNLVDAQDPLMPENCSKPHPVMTTNNQDEGIANAGLLRELLDRL